jgi:hypothetical protein
MRQVNRIEKYQVDPEISRDETRLAKAFTIRSLQFISSDPGDRRNQLTNDLK